MNILELDQYNLADAVRFHDHLNPRIWDEGEHLRPEVRERLLAIAADFQEFLGVTDLDVEDITISGSNAAYSYTPHSDIDLHLVVRMPEQCDEVYQELFNAKKYQYNDLHDIRIRGADVELYVQPSNEPVVSLGEYSVLKDQWLQVPRRQRADIDHSLVRHKYEDLKARIERALKEDDADRVQALVDKIKVMRRAGLARHGEFGPENLVFKMLRTQGWIQRLYDRLAAAQDQELSLMEKNRKKTPWSWGGYWSQPEADTDSGMAEGITPDTIHQLADQKGIKWDNEPSFLQLTKRLTGKEHLDDLDQKQLLKVKRHLDQQDVAESPNGVSPETKMFLSEEPDREVLKSFIQWVRGRLGIKKMPRVLLHVNRQWSEQNHSFGRYDPDTHTLHVSLPGRHMLDIMRTTAHELAHCRQHEIEPLPDHAGETGSDWENEAHAVAGIIMRDYADAHPDQFQDHITTEDADDVDSMKWPGEPLPFPKGTVKVGVSDVYDWYKLGQQISDLDDADPRNFGRGAPQTVLSFGSEPLEHKYLRDLRRLGMPTTDIDESASGYIPTRRQARDPRFVMALTKDIRPGEVGRQANKLRLKTDSQGHPDILMKGLRNALEQFKATGQYLSESEQLAELRMSPSSLRAEAAKTGALAGMEFEMIVPGVGGVGEDQEMERDYGPDRRVRGLSDLRDFFYDGDYNSRRDAERLADRIWEDYMDSDWLSERKQEEWGNSAPGAIRDWVEQNERDDLGAKAAEQVQQESDDPNWNLDNPDFRAQVERRTEELIDQRTDDIDANLGPEYDEVFDQWVEDDWNDQWNNDDMFTDWLESEGISHMSDIENSYDITWPYWESGENAEDNIQSVADDFAGAIDRPVRASADYHGARRDSTSYIVEPDGSLSPDDSDDAGLEFVSPPLPVDDLLSDLSKVKAWAESRGAYTNKSTGLHINVSVPDLDTNQLDYVKLALLLGDEYVLNQFGRMANTYAKSAMGKIRDRAVQRSEELTHYMDLMRQGLAREASQMIHAPRTDKYTSINVKQGYVEFRSPGGDWLNEDLSKIENTLLRFVVALSAAADPQKERKEYLKKLYQVLAPRSESDPVAIFARYSAGELPQSALKSFIRQIQLQRKVKKSPSGEKYWWEVTLNGEGQDGPGMEIVATSEQEALARAAQAWNTTAAQMPRATARPIRPTEVDVGQTGPRRSQTSAATQHATNPLYQEPETPSPAQQPTGGTWTGRWQVVDVYGGGRVLYTFGGVGNDRQAAARIGSEWARNNGITQIINVQPEMDQGG